MEMLTPDFLLVNMNSGKKENIDAEERKNTIKLILENERPTLAFVQQFTWKDLHELAFKSVDIPQNYEMFWSTSFRDSVIIFDTTAINCQPLDPYDVQRIYREARNAFSPDMLEREPRMASYMFKLDRLYLCRIESKRPPGHKLLCASWHGPNKGHLMGEGENPKQLYTDEKKEIARSLLIFLERIKENFNLPLMVGGDFNLKSTEVEMTQTFSRSTPNHESKKFWIISNDFHNRCICVGYQGQDHQAFDNFVLKIMMVEDNLSPK